MLDTKILNKVFRYCGKLGRGTPNFKGKYRVAWFLNQWFLRSGIGPTVDVPMNSGCLIRVDLRSRTEFYAYYTGYYARERIAELCSVMVSNNNYAQSNLFLDVGANIGFYGVAVAKQVPKSPDGVAKVLAFEPVQSNFKRLEENVELNGMREMINCYPFGLSDHARNALITLREDFQSGATTGNAALKSGIERDAGFDTQSVRLEVLDGIAHKLPLEGKTIRAIKLDIEGHEDSFLRGADGTISRHRPLILMEINRGYYKAREVELDDLFWPALPPAYLLFGLREGRWQELNSFRDCRYMEDVYLKPKEMQVAFLDGK